MLKISKKKKKIVKKNFSISFDSKRKKEIKIEKAKIDRDNLSRKNSPPIGSVVNETLKKSWKISSKSERKIFSEKFFFTSSERETDRRHFVKLSLSPRILHKFVRGKKEFPEKSPRKIWFFDEKTFLLDIDSDFYRIHKFDKFVRSIVSNCRREKSSNAIGNRSNSIRFDVAHFRSSNF